MVECGAGADLEDSAQAGWGRIPDMKQIGCWSWLGGQRYVGAQAATGRIPGKLFLTHLATVPSNPSLSFIWKVYNCFINWEQKYGFDIKAPFTEGEVSRVSQELPCSLSLHWWLDFILQWNLDHSESYFVFLVAAIAVWESLQAVQRSCTACELSQTAVAATRDRKYDSK